MPRRPPMKTLAEVQAWLQSLEAGAEVDVGSARFDAEATLVRQLFELLPDSDPIALSDLASDDAAGTLEGTATVLGEDATVTFRFRDAEAELLCELELELADSVEWELVPDLDVSFGRLSAYFMPSREARVITMTFAATLFAGAERTLQVPVRLSVPSFDGDWLVSAGEVEAGKLSADALSALTAGVGLDDLLPKELADPSKLTLKGLDVAFDPLAATCSSIRIAVEYDGDWEFFDGHFTVEAVGLELVVIGPLKSASLHATLTGTLRAGKGPSFQVGGLFPDKAVFAHLLPGNELRVASVFEFFGIDLPNGFPDIEISRLGFVFHPANNAFRFELAIDHPVPVVGGIALESFLFEITTAYDSSAKAFQGRGMLAGQLLIGNTYVLLSGSYASAGGLRLSGRAGNVPVGHLIETLTGAFGIEAEAIPGPLRTLTLDSIDVSVDTGAQSFKFDCAARTTIAGVEVDFKPSIAVEKKGNGFDASFNGTMVLRAKLPDGRHLELEFEYEFADEAGASSITASARSSTGILLADLAAAFGHDLPPIPSALDLSLRSLALSYDFTKEELVIGAATSHGAATLATLKVEGGQRALSFVLAADVSFSLSNLPLVGQELGALEDVGVRDVRVVVSTPAPVETATVGTINRAIARLGSMYPTLPSRRLQGPVLLSVDLAIGDQVFPLDVSLGGESGASSPAPALQAAPSPASSPAPAGGPVSPSSSADGTTWFVVQRNFGPLSLQRVGARYEAATETLWFELDASLAYGPMTLSLVGLAVGVPLKSLRPTFSLHGFGASYVQPPVTVAGSFVDIAPQGSHRVELEGGVTIGAEDVTVEAFGYFGEITDAAGRQFTSMFVFGEVTHDFGGPPAFFVTGIALGFGYNSDLRLPAIEEVDSFPFVQVLPGGPVRNEKGGDANDPLSVLTRIMSPPAWVTPRPGSLWFAAGITFTSFKLVNSRALAVVDVGEELVLALVGTARAQFPQTGPPYALVELDLLVRFAPAEGEFAARASLSNASFLLDKACKLTGGFAFCVWSGPSPHSGDFVLTLGGYHPGFAPPAHYPRVPTVGFRWALDSKVTVSGGAYLALTPAALMLGGRLDVTYTDGSLKAWFDAHADVTVRWNPVWFEASIGVRIGASYRLGSSTISAELSCDLALWGPPTGGSVTVDWYVISFTVAFGSPKSGPAQVHRWADVEAMLPGGADSPPSFVTVAAVSGLLPAPGKSPKEAGPWHVQPSRFAFRVSTPIPATNVEVGAHGFADAPLRVHPLGWEGAAAPLTTTISDESGTEVSDLFDVALTRRDVPASLWGSPPETGGRPGVPDGAGQLVKDRVVGATVEAKPPRVGASPGPVDAGAYLSSVELDSPAGSLPLSAAAQPSGRPPVDAGSLERIADRDRGITSPAVTAARTALYSALRSLGYVTAESNDPMDELVAQIDGVLSAAPLLIP